MNKPTKTKVRLAFTISDATPGFEKLSRELADIEKSLGDASPAQIKQAHKKHLMRIFLDYSLGIGGFSRPIQPIEVEEVVAVRSAAQTRALPSHTQLEPSHEPKPVKATPITPEQFSREAAAHLGIDFD